MVKSSPAALTSAEWLRIGSIGSAVLALHLLGFGMLALAVHSGAGALIGVGTGLTAYAFGLRHAFDADHIAAIDNTTRKLLNDGRKPMGVGFFFSLGHSTIVLAMSAVIALVATNISGALNANSALRTVGEYLGTSISALFLYAVGILNLLILAGILRTVRDLRNGTYDEEDLEAQLASRGLMNRLAGRIFRSVRSSWQMYIVGVLFGLGFDTATEVGLLALSAGAAAGGLPWYATLSLPLIFAAGMSLMDSIDGAFMSVAYGWAFSNPARKLFYNLSITGLSVAVALLIGSLEVLSVVARYFHMGGPFWSGVRDVDLNAIGFVIVGLFIATSAGALLIWRVGNIEERWSGPPADPC